MKCLYEIIEKLKGNVLIIGIKDENVIQKIEENSNIQTCYFLNACKKEKNENKEKKQTRNFNIHYLRKKFRKKKIDDILCHVDDIYPYLKSFVKDSVYINRGYLYLYGESTTYDLEKTVKKYEKYHASVTVTTEKNFFFMTVSNQKSKTNRWKDM